MTIREEPLRRIVDVETFILMSGGEYFPAEHPGAQYLLRRGE